MKFGIIAAVLVVLGVLVALVMISPSGTGSWSTVPALTIIVYFVFIGPPSAFVMSIMGINRDKHKSLTWLTMLLSIAWIVVVTWAALVVMLLMALLYVMPSGFLTM